MTYQPDDIKGLIQMTRPLNSIEATLLNERLASTRADGTLGAPVDLTKVTDYCTRCGADCAPTTSLYIDPLCTGCIHTLRATDRFLPLDTPHDFSFALAPIVDSSTLILRII